MVVVALKAHTDCKKVVFCYTVDKVNSETIAQRELQVALLESAER